MDKKRFLRMQRIVKVQRQQEDALRYEIAVANSEITQLEEKSAELTGYWGSQEGALGEVVNKSIDRKLKTAAQEKFRKEALVKSLTDKLIGEKRKTNMAQKQRDVAKQKHDRNEEKKTLTEIGELQVLKNLVRSG
ncbi:MULTISPECIES: hypothetical protein [Pseudovibrio]|uniref:hypothetical protein n=1 Tax=Stappiaceae TaxID=2821832 RepID=UPI002366B4E2|nr:MULTISPECIES: hypothetical protein [Pseudovibrio]MDD7908994.1 hypothetical protein [Pseudovibrio exalbescens]MDX5593685.1 hypothetical protein [Pseudovibrio sp. SPO723]